MIKINVIFRSNLNKNNMEKRTNNIIFYLNNFILINQVTEEKHKLIIAGSIKQEYLPKEIKKYSGGLIKSIKRKPGINQPDTFIVNMAKQYKIPPLNIILFLITIITTLLAGSLMEGANPFSNPSDILQGFPFSFTILLILGCHEFGHYYFAKKHKVDVSLPYFIPAPSMIGTFGAVIKMRSPIRKKTALIEIGAAGPIAGFIIAIPSLVIGLKLSRIVPLDNSEGFTLGDSLLTALFTKLMYPDILANETLMISSVGFAAWIGLLVTMLNLLPIGQLDGGHIIYGFFGNFHKKIGYITLILIVLLGAIPMFWGVDSYNWFVWAALVFFLVKVKHPPIYDAHVILSLKHKIIGMAALLIFILTFIPIPFKI